MRFIQKSGGMWRRAAVLALACTALSGCTYDLGLGYASDGYDSDYSECDPYGGFDNYYDCDSGYGFSNIGYGGGWYDNFYYPGYGIFLFDNYGSRHRMRDHHRRYWGERRHKWYRDNRGRYDGGRRDGRGRDGRGPDNRGRGYTDNDGLDTIGWPERGGGRVRDGDRYDRGRGDGMRDRNRGPRAGGGDGADATPIPAPDAGRGDRAGRGAGRRGDGGGYGQPPPPRSGSAAPPAAQHVDTPPQNDVPRAAPSERRGRQLPEKQPD